MKGWPLLKDFLTLSRKDRVGMTVMLLLSLLFFVMPDWPRREQPISLNQEDSAWVIQWRLALAADSAETTFNRSGKALVSVPAENRKSIKHELFPFDPNELDSAGWRRLGLREKTVRTILNYRSKGGRFREPDDLSRVYGLFPDEYERLRPYVRITRQATNHPETKKALYADGSKAQKAFDPVVVNINSADSATWEALPGIGPRLSQRITRYREALGGFYRIEQVAETYGLADSVYQKIRDRLQLGTPIIRQIAINQVSLEVLSAHPYISTTLARRLLAYRQEHGAFARLEDLRAVIGVDDKLLKKLAPYLSFSSE